MGKLASWFIIYCGFFMVSFCWKFDILLYRVLANMQMGINPKCNGTFCVCSLLSIDRKILPWLLIIKYGKPNCLSIRNFFLLLPFLSHFGQLKLLLVIFIFADFISWEVIRIGHKNKYFNWFLNEMVNLRFIVRREWQFWHFLGGTWSSVMPCEKSHHLSINYSKSKVFVPSYQ
jgi:hypothetical protein